MKMAKQCWILTFLLLPVLADGRQAAPSTGDFHAEIQHIYDFQPHNLTKAQIAEKSLILDQFWAKAKSQPDAYASGLRRELADFANSPFFLFDGSQLLLTLSKDSGDRKIVLAAIAHSDLRDLQWKDYFLLVQYMAAQGEDTTAAAFHILAEPKFQVFIPEHYLTLAQDYCLVYMLLPSTQDFWLQPAIERLHGENDVTAQKSLLLLLWYAQTSRSDKALGEFSNGPGKPQASKDYANALIHRKDSVDPKMVTAAGTASEDSLRQARRERLKAVSDEALIDLDEYTAKIMAKRR